MKPEELTELATLAYGENWRTPLCEAAGISRKMLYHYESGGHPIPEARRAAIIKACRSRIIKQLGKLQKALDRLI